MQGLIVVNHVVGDVPAYALRTGVALLGTANPHPTGLVDAAQVLLDVLIHPEKCE
jgi:hypothetical protein